MHSGMDNAVESCNGITQSYNGYCDNDYIIYFRNKYGQTCQTRWLFNNARWQRGRLEENGDDAFDSPGWDGWTWYQAGCAKEWGFYVPNKVLPINKMHCNTVVFAESYNFHLIGV